MAEVKFFTQQPLLINDSPKRTRVVKERFHVRRIKIPRALLLTLLASHGRHNLPSNAKLEEVWYSPEDRSFNFIISHPSFSEVAEDRIVPEFDWVIDRRPLKYGDSLRDLWEDIIAWIKYLIGK